VELDPRSGRETRITMVPARCRRLKGSWLDDVPAFSASGTHVFYSHSGDCDRRMPDGLYRLSLTGGPPQLVMRDTRNLVTWWPAPARQGGRFVFINDLPISPRQDADEFQDRIYSARVGPNRPRRLSPRNATSDEFPSVSASGRVAFSRDHRRLVVGRSAAPLRSSLRSIVTLRSGTLASSDWSPAGKRIVFERQPGGRFRSDLHVVRARGGTVRRLTSLGNAVSPVWSPSGRWIAFARSPNSRPTKGPLYIVPSKGGRPRKLLDGIDVVRLSWQPR